jgi:hypothetical protein
MKLHAQTRLAAFVGVSALALAHAGSGLVAAQGVALSLQGRLLQRSDGTIYIYREGMKALVHPAELSDEEINAIPDAPDTNVADPTPGMPEAVPVALPASTTAFLVLDLQTSSCPLRPTCVASLPRVADLLARARGAGLAVIYSDTAPTAVILPEVAPLPDEPRVSSSADKFFRTNLDELLHARGIQTVLIVGTAANGAVLYTAFQAAARGYTVVVAEDGMSGISPYIETYTRYQLLNGPGTTNPGNTPLARGVTISRTDLVTFE